MDHLVHPKMGFIVGAISGYVFILGLFQLQEYRLHQDLFKSIKLIQISKQNMIDSTVHKRAHSNEIRLPKRTESNLSRQWHELRAKIGLGEARNESFAQQNTHSYQKEGLRDIWNDGIRKVGELLLG